MRNNAIKIQKDNSENASALTQWQPMTYLKLAVNSVHAAPQDYAEDHSDLGAPDLGAFEEQYLLGYACFA